MSTSRHDHVYLEIPDESGIWLLSEAQQRFTPKRLADARPATCFVRIDSVWGHFVAARWLQAAASLLDARRSEAQGLGTEHVRKVRLDAREVASRYLGLTTRPPRGWQPELDGSLEDYVNSWLPDAVAEVETMLGELGYVTQWEDGGVSTWHIADHAIGADPASDGPKPARTVRGLPHEQLAEARYLGADAAMSVADNYSGMSMADARSILDDVEPKVLDRYPPPILNGDSDQSSEDLAREVLRVTHLRQVHVALLTEAWEEGRDLVWDDALQAVALQVDGEVGWAQQVDLATDQRVVALQQEAMRHTAQTTDSEPAGTPGDRRRGNA